MSDEKDTEVVEETTTKKVETKKSESPANTNKMSTEKNAEKIPRLIYIGPNLFKHELITNKVYKGDFKIPDEVKGQYSLINQLLVPIDKMHAASIAMQTKGTPQYLALQQLKGE